MKEKKFQTQARRDSHFSRQSADESMFEKSAKSKGVRFKFLAEIAYFWKRQRDALLLWGFLLLLFGSGIWLWTYCGSLTGVWHFFRNGFSRDGDFAVQTVRAGEFAGQKRTLEIGGVEYVFRWCPRGNFRMGSPETEEGRSPEEAVHRVELTYGFWILETEVTREMWAAVMQTEPVPEEEKYLPVTDVSWKDAVFFCEKLGRLAKYRMQLPTEAQWEYACRAKGSRPFHADPVRAGWFEENAKGKVRPVKKRRGNQWFIYDMHGNAAEWCRDLYDEDYYAKSPEKNPQGPTWGRFHVVRGGAFDSKMKDCRAAARESQQNVRKAGFRVVVEYVPKKKASSPSKAKK